VEFRSQQGATWGSGPGGFNSDMEFENLGLENETGTTPTVPSFTCTQWNGSAFVRNGAACANLEFHNSGASGYYASTWPDGFDYNNLGAYSSVIIPNGQFNIMGVSAIWGGPTDTKVVGSNNNIENVTYLDKVATTPAAGIGESSDYRIQNSTNTLIDAGKIQADLTTVTAGAETSEFNFLTKTGGAALVNTLTLTGALSSFSSALSVTNATGITSPLLTSVELKSGSATNTDLDGELTNSAGSSSFTFGGTYTIHPICTANDETATNAVRVTYTGTTSVTFTAGTTDIISYHCQGRN
jgi:hypothetical protein